MSEEQLEELQEYNLEYLEAQQSEEIFGGDYTSAIELKYAKKEIERLNKALQDIKDFIDKHTKIIRETNTKYLLTNVKDDNVLIDIVNKALGDE